MSVADVVSEGKAEAESPGDEEIIRSVTREKLFKDRESRRMYFFNQRIIVKGVGVPPASSRRISTSQSGKALQSIHPCLRDLSAASSARLNESIRRA